MQSSIPTDSVYITNVMANKMYKIHQSFSRSISGTFFSLTELNLINVSKVAVEIWRRANGHFEVHRMHSWTHKEAGSALKKHEFLCSRQDILLRDAETSLKGVDARLDSTW